MHQAPAEPLHRHRQCQNAQVILEDDLKWSFSRTWLCSTKSFLCYHFQELKSHCQLCSLVVKDDQEDEFQQLGPEVKQAFFHIWLCYMLK